VFFEDHDSESEPFADYVEEEESYYVASPGAISLQTLVVNVEGKTGAVETIALLDSGSTITLIDAQLAKLIQAIILQTNVPRSVKYVDRKADFTSDRVQVALTNENTHQNVVAWTVPKISNAGIVDWSVVKDQFDYLKDIPFPSLPPGAKLGLIIGTDHNFLLRPIQVIDDPSNPRGPRATLTPLGWTCTGPSSSPDKVKFKSYSN
jgi:hypothetical protein